MKIEGGGGGVCCMGICLIGCYFWLQIVNHFAFIIFSKKKSGTILSLCKGRCVLQKNLK